MSTEVKENTKDEVARLHKEGKSPAEIAAALGKTPATVYNHLRNLGFGHGKRGRPRKTEGEGNGKPQETKAEVKPRPRPGTQAKAPAKSTAKAESNGNDTSTERFPKVAEAIEVELREARSRVATLEGMLEAFKN